VLVVTLEGTRLFVSGREKMMAPCLIQTGGFDTEFTWFLRRTLRPGDTYVDVGANVGYYVVVAARRVGPSGRVVAFEPSPHMREFLIDNVQMSGDRGQVTVRPVAVADAPGRAVFGIPRGYDVAAGLGVTNMDDADDGIVVDQMEVPVVCLDDELAGQGPLAVIKIDVEGGEGAVLEGMRGLLAARRVRTIVLEVNTEAHERIGNRTGWDTMTRELRALDREGYSWSTLDRLGARCPTTLEQALAEPFLAHLLADAPT